MEESRSVQVPHFARKLAELFLPSRLYFVGGYVRNSVMGLAGGDYDLCSSLTPDAVEELLGDKNVKVVPKAKELGTVELHMDGHVFEHTTFRSDYYSNGGTHRPDRVDFTDSIEKDALRRDFTVNALYCDAMTGEITDPLGGISAIRERKLYSCDLPQKTLSEDGLRILRLMRFACQLDLAIDKNLYEQAVAHMDYLHDISKERIRDELTKLLLCDEAYPQLRKRDSRPQERALKLLTDSGAMFLLFPPLRACVGVMQKTKYHAYDVYGHCLQTCAAAPPQIELRLAALLHDIGKPLSLEKQGDMHCHDLLSANLASSLLGHEGLKYPLKTVERVATLIKEHMFDITGAARESTVRKKLGMLGVDVSRQLIALRKADIEGSGRDATPDTARRMEKILEEMISQQVPFSMAQLKISGAAIMRICHLPAGKQIGEIKRRLWMHCIQHPAHNDEKWLQRMMRGFCAETYKDDEEK
ncbi:MAG: CCA tRNA nucleotidyltransferase [Christensenellales bacterium]